MRRKIFIISFLILILFTGASCDNSSSSGSGSNSGSGVSYKGGDKALVAEFADNAPPSKVFDTHPFSIRVLIENLGEATIDQGEGFARLSGISPNDFGLDYSDTLKDLNQIRGYKKQGSNTIEGGRDQIIFSGLKYSGNQFEGIYNANFFVDLCYPYQTRASARLCVSDDLDYDNQNTNICEVNQDLDVENSAGPVHIENLKQNSAGSSSIYINFDIVHKPQSNYAQVARIGSIDNDCRINGNKVSSSESYNDIDYVKFKVETGLDGLNCQNTGSNSGEIQLNDNKASIFCTQDISGEEEHEKPIRIILEYDYFDSQSKKIEIEHINR